MEMNSPYESVFIFVVLNRSMEMKKVLFALTAVASLVVMNAAQAADGQVKFTGTITADACTINNGSAGALPVDLGTVSASAMAGKDTKSTPTKFTIALTACPATLTQAAVKFDGESDPVDNTLLKLDEGSGATGVGIEIGQADGTPLPLYTASEPVAIDVTSHAANLDFIGRYKSTTATPGAGSATGTSDFTINYN